MLGLSLGFLDRWLEYDQGTLDDHQEFFARKREILFRRILVLTILIILLIIIKDIFFMKMAVSVIMDAAILLIILASLAMIKAGYQMVAKGFFLVLMNGFTTFYASSLPPNRGIFLYFFPLITMAFAIFDDDEGGFRLAFILLPLVLLFLTIFSDFSLLGDFKLATAKNGRYNLIINATITSAMIVFFVEFIMKANRDSERLLSNLAEDVRRKKDDLEKVNRELDRFVYSTSHDLRAPLSSIMGLVKLALSDPATAGQDKQYFSMIADRTNKLDDFINEIIDYSRNARMEIRPEETDPAAVANEVITNLQFIEHAGRINFNIRNEAGTLMLDKGRVKIVLNNLISNTIKYQNQYAESSEVTITASATASHCTLTIADNGIGIRQELQGRIFEMFYRATDKSTGSGLGLYIVNEIVNRMNGTISVKSEFGKGTEFTIVLPILS